MTLLICEKSNEMNTYKEKFIVKETDCISDISSELPSVLSTYILVKWMEIVSARLINKQLDTQKYMTMGKRVDIEHSSMAKLGEEVMVEATMVEQCKREVLFSVLATIGEKEIAKATHIRSLISKKVVAKMIGKVKNEN